MNQISKIKPVYDLEERTFLFAKNVRIVLKRMKRDLYSEDDIIINY